MAEAALFGVFAICFVSFALAGEQEKRIKALELRVQELEDPLGH